MKTIKTFLQMTLVAMTICLLTAVTYAGNITIVTESQSTIVETDTVNVESDISTATLSCADTQIISQSGEMAIPSKIIKVLLPPDADLSTVECVVQSADYEKVKGALVVKPVPPIGTRINGVNKIVWPKGKTIVNGKDVAIYKADAFWPRKSAQVVSTGKLRNFKIVEIVVPLASCNPVGKNLWLLTDAVVRIDFDRADEIEPVDTLGAKRAKKSVVNFGQYADEYDVLPAGMSSTGYTILTMSATQSASTKLDDFVSHKQAMGFDVQVVTESAWGGGTGNKAYRNIRGWLQDNYIADDILYVLLIGDPDPGSGDVPMKRSIEKHTDWLYSDLSGDDRMWEVIVGRIPYYGVPADLDSILQKTMDYENEVNQVWHKNTLLPMVPYDDITPNFPCGEAIKYDLLEPAGISSVRIYEEDYDLDPPPEYIFAEMHPATCWANNPFGMVVWLTHGAPSVASGVIDNGQVPWLNDAYPSIAFMGSCTNSDPFTPDNLGYNILKNGGIGTVGATSYSYYYANETEFLTHTSNGGFAYNYAMRIAERQSCGLALADLKEVLVPGIVENFMVYNLFGDPSVVVIPEPSTDFDPPVPDPMTWATMPYAIGSHSVAMEASVATDAENGVEYKFICTGGGGNDSAWQAGTSYTDTGLPGGIQYTYTVTARDTSGNLNETAPSSAESATTDAEYNAPTPNPMTWATPPAAGSSTSIYMVATTATDPSGVEYYFECTAGGGNDSGWQDSPAYEDMGLAPLTEYTYTVTACDLSAAQNTTVASAPAMGKTASDFNVVLPANGGVLESFTSEYGGGWVATDLTNGVLDEDGWASAANPTSPQEFVYSFAGGQDAVLDVAVVHAGLGEGGAYFSKDVEVWTSANGTDYTLKGSDTLLNQALDSVSIPLGGVTAKKVKLAVTSGYTSSYWELAEFQVYGAIDSTPDTDPPTPNPATFASAPAAVSSSEITMTVTTGSDATTPVEYFFDETTDGPGATDSGWVTDPVYNDTELDPDTQYTYTVQMRDSVTPTPNVGTVSSPANATTDPAGADIYVYDITMSGYEPKTGYYAAKATIWIKDSPAGDNVDGATVAGNWSGATTSGDGSGDTGGDGKVILESKAVKGGGTFTFTVTNVTATGYTYNSSLNNEDYDSITLP